jgi:hypothetical protein
MKPIEIDRSLRDILKQQRDNLKRKSDIRYLEFQKQQIRLYQGIRDSSPQIDQRLADK